MYKYKYSIHGPFEIKTDRGVKNNKAVNDTIEAKKAFWDDVENKVKGLPSACGCYLFAIQKVKNIKPWYVGLAEKGFQKECFGYHKIGIYTQVLNKCKSGKPILFLIAKRTKINSKFVKPSKKGHKKDIIFLETLLIGTAIEKNPALMNIMKTKYLRNMRVPGLINTPQGKQSDQASKFKMAIK